MHILEWPPLCPEARLDQDTWVLCSVTEFHLFCNLNITFLSTMQSIVAVHVHCAQIPASVRRLTDLLLSIPDQTRVKTFLKTLKQEAQRPCPASPTEEGKADIVLVKATIPAWIKQGLHYPVTLYI